MRSRSRSARTDQGPTPERRGGTRQGREEPRRPRPARRLKRRVPLTWTRTAGHASPEMGSPRPPSHLRPSPQSSPRHRSARRCAGSAYHGPSMRRGRRRPIRRGSRHRSVRRVVGRFLPGGPRLAWPASMRSTRTRRARMHIAQPCIARRDA